MKFLGEQRVTHRHIEVDEDEEGQAGLAGSLVEGGRLV